MNSGIERRMSREARTRAELNSLAAAVSCCKKRL